MAFSTLPTVPMKHADFIPYVKGNSGTPLTDLLEPYKQYDAKLREIFAQEPNHPALSDHYLNLVSVFDGYQDALTIHARKLESESAEEKARYVLPLSDENRKPHGSPAIVQDLKEFQKNFTVFCESSLVDMDWSNVVAAGSSVVTSLLPVPEKFKKSKNSLRKYYHETIAPASDVDLFIYGLSEEEAIKKIIQIETKIKESILSETTTVRTKNAITIASSYPTRHIQIVLRIYKSISEILTGFDVDCSCAAYDGQRVYASPRALVAYMTQCNSIDLTRRSPSYESRLSKYSHRGFEVYWPLLDRSRIDPTIFERNFARTVGLARLLVLERLPTSSERQQYMDQRREERGRPRANRNFDYSKRGNIKAAHEDEIADWVEEEEVSDYHTFTIPYGPKFHAKKIEKLLYTKDLLLNAEWNKPKDREVNLHRHPAFFGYAEDVIHDCCGFCPKPATPEEHEIAEEEAKIYVSGKISFIKDNPGRQAIGSFNPITDDDWTEMAYIGNTARLCQAIIDHDLEHVEDWLAQEGSDPNCRDYTGRTPLHLATICSTPEIVQSLINYGARLVARLADGRTALHLAAARGNVEMVKMILQKSEANEEEEAKKEDLRKGAKSFQEKNGHSDIKEPSANDTAEREEGSSDSTEESDVEVIDDEESSDAHSATTGSFVKVKPEEKDQDDMPLDDEDEPDVYDINVLAWDTQCSPLHLAILNGHTDVVKELVQNFGADVLLPVKLLTPGGHGRGPRRGDVRDAILTLVLALQLPLEKAKEMTQTLLELGASCAQADTTQTTAFHFISVKEPGLLQLLLEHDEPSVKRAINHACVPPPTYNRVARTPLMSAILSRNPLAALKLLEVGADCTLEFEQWMKTMTTANDWMVRQDSTHNENEYYRNTQQPVILAVQTELPEIILSLLSHGADPNTLTTTARSVLRQDGHYYGYDAPESLLDAVRAKIEQLKNYEKTQEPAVPKQLVDPDRNYLEGIEPGSYRYFSAKFQLDESLRIQKKRAESYDEALQKYKTSKDVIERTESLNKLAAEFEKVEAELLKRGAKTFKELYPKERWTPSRTHNHYQYDNDPKPLEVVFDFTVGDLNDAKREAYVKLFEAAWEGNLSTIRSLTLEAWGPNNENIPLRITVADKHNVSPFHIALFCGHIEVAKAILEIAFAQYEKKEEKVVQERYRIGDDADYSEDESDHEGDSSDNDAGNVPIFREVIQDEYTIENIGEVATKVKSDVLPTSLFTYNCSLWSHGGKCLKEQDYRPHWMTATAWAIALDDKKMFSLLLSMKQNWSSQLHSLGLLDSPSPTFTSHEFESALSRNRIDMLAEMIKLGGAGMQLEGLVKTSGVKLKEPPKYYQGLSVHGKKRADWVAAARGERQEEISEADPPVLDAAFQSAFESVKWFLGDEPARLYREFAEVNQSNKYIAHLNKLSGGFEGIVTKWLGARRELIIHCAVMAKADQEAEVVLKYLIERFPEYLEKQSANGLTPLSLAFTLRRFDAARMLIAAGANQAVRDEQRRNLIHLLLTHEPAYPTTGDKVLGLKDFFDLIDRRLIPSLLTERCSSEISGTPLAEYVHCLTAPGRARPTEASETNALPLLLELGAVNNNEHLELLDSAGDTPVHEAIRKKDVSLLRTMLEARPDLLYRENATGRTPAEMAEDAYIAACVAHAPTLKDNLRYVNSYDPKPLIVLEKDERYNYMAAREREKLATEQTWAVCKEVRDSNPGKRRLVSLADANEVAKRLATRREGKSTTYSRRRYRRPEVGDNASEDGEKEGGDEEEGTQDEVGKWFNKAQWWDVKKNLSIQCPFFLGGRGYYQE